MHSKVREVLGEIVASLITHNFTRVLPLKKVSENKYFVAFYHPQPTYKLHIVIVPKCKIESVEKIDSGNLVYIDEIFKVIPKLINNLGIKDYSLITNGGKKQDIKQLHFHLISDYNIRS